MGAKWKAASLGRFRPLFTRVLGRCCLRLSILTVGGNNSWVTSWKLCSPNVGLR